MVEYPPAERLDLVEDLHGHRVADPYRWLEDADDPRTKDWLAAQEALTAAELAALPGREALAARLESLLRAGSVGAPVWRAGRAFFTRQQPDAEQPVLYVQDRDGTRCRLVDVNTLDPSGMTTLDDWWPSREGARPWRR